MRKRIWSGAILSAKISFFLFRKKQIDEIMGNSEESLGKY